MPEKILENWRVRNICDLVATEPAVVREDCSWDDLLVELVEHPSTRHVYVVNDDGRLTGVVRLNGLMKRLFPYAAMAEQGESFSMSLEGPFEAGTAADVMTRDPRHVTKDTPVTELIEMMVREDVSELPVVDETGRVTGEVNVLEVIAGYLRAKDE